MFITRKQTKKILWTLPLLALFALSSTAIIAPAHSYADTPTCVVNNDGTLAANSPSPCVLPGSTSNGGVVVCNDPNVQSTDKACQTGDTAANKASSCSGGAGCTSLITDYIDPFIRVLTLLMGIIVVLSIVVGGIMYASAGGDPNKVVAARKRITNSVLALLAYLFLFSFLQYILPGGVL